MVCLECGEPFEYNCTLPNHKGFCSPECYRKSRKFCLECGQKFESEDRQKLFCSNSCADKYYHKSYCGKQTRNRYMRRWIQKNKVHFEAYMKGWRLRNPEKVKEYRKKAYQKHKKKIRSETL